MPVTLTPIPCACGQIVGYEIRMGREHHSAEASDPYEGVCMAWERRTPDGRKWAYIGMAHGRIPPGDYWAVMEALIDLGYEWVAYEHDGKISPPVTKFDVARRRQRRER
ncbi:hypothetical protein [Geoalkalibacter sp.]|uniref:hypothetical protein n=1 Tax=Geoalkalibacter sp. TaxID=3041440 RepID=UPI00272EAA67|nr:hypothetical protein [Geoalkalibacter sp.]